MLGPVPWSLLLTLTGVHHKAFLCSSIQLERSSRKAFAACHMCLFTTEGVVCGQQSRVQNTNSRIYVKSPVTALRRLYLTEGATLAQFISALLVWRDPAMYLYTIFCPPPRFPCQGKCLVCSRLEFEKEATSLQE